MTLSRKQLGPILWIMSMQYFTAQLAVALYFINGYSLANNTISDLGNTVCGPYGAMYVCSPLHLVMNISFVVQGSTMLTGALLIKKLFPKSPASTVGFGCMVLAGVGTILVGLFPENTVSVLHILGAGLPFMLGNAGMIVLGLSLQKLPKWLKIYTILSGIIGLVGLVLFLAHLYLGLGIGGMERIVAYPQTIWMIVLGSYLLITDPK